MVAILSDALKSGGLGTLHQLPDELIEEIVDDTFQEARQKYFSSGQANEDGNHGGVPNDAGSVMASGQDGDAPPLRGGPVLDIDDEDVITFDMYEKMVYDNNDIIKWLAIDLQRVC